MSTWLFLCLLIMKSFVKHNNEEADEAEKGVHSNNNVKGLKITSNGGIRVS